PAPCAAPVARAGDRLLQDAAAAVGSGARELVVDPFVDANTGQQTNATVQSGPRPPGLIPRRVPTWNVQALTRAALAAKPLLLIGTLTPINSKAAKDENAGAFAILPLLID